MERVWQDFELRTWDCFLDSFLGEVLVFLADSRDLFFFQNFFPIALFSAS
jgi:hypothetical protein